MYFFTADEHYGHTNIIKYCNRPFSSVEEMDEELIKRHNEVVSYNDIVIHAGDFTLASIGTAYKYLDRLNGKHTCLRGSHDRWLPIVAPYVFEKKIGRRYIVICHYAMRVWARSHYNSWMLYGHSHGKLPPIGKQHDIGVDNNGFYPVSFDLLEEIMKERLDNPNLVRTEY